MVTALDMRDSASMISTFEVVKKIDEHIRRTRVSLESLDLCGLCPHRAKAAIILAAKRYRKTVCGMFECKLNKSKS